MNSLSGETSFRESSVWKEALLFGLIGLAVFVPAFWWGLPHANNAISVHGWDVDAVTGLQALSELHNLISAPKEDWWLAYPLFHYFLLYIAYAPYLAGLYLTGAMHSPSGVYPFGFEDPVEALKVLSLMGKFITLMMAAGIVVCTYMTARTVWDKWTARLASILVMLPTPIVYYARTGNLDIPVLFWMSAAFLVIAKSTSNGLTSGRAVLMGVLSALAVATKDQAYAPLLAGMAVAVLVHVFRDSGGKDLKAKLGAPILIGISGLISFLLAGGIVIWPRRFAGHVAFVRNFQETFWNVKNLGLLHPQTPAGYIALTGDIFYDLLIGAGPLMLALAVAGIVLAIRREPFTFVLLAAFLAHIALVVYPVRHMQYRYVLVMIFIAAMFGGRAAAAGIAKGGLAKVAAVVLFVAAAGWAGLRSTDLTYQMWFDARYAAGNWIEENAKAGDTVAAATLTGISPLPDRVSAVSLMGDPDPVGTLENERVRFVIVQPDFSSDVGEDRSRFFPAEHSRRIEDGSLGYLRKAHFKTEPLLRLPLLDLPLTTPHLVNPEVTIFEKGNN